MKHIHFKVSKINLVALLHICNFLKARLLLFFLNHETKNKCKRVIRPWKSNNLCYVHIFHTMKWKHAHLSDRLPLINSATLRHGVGNCVYICLIDNLKLNYSRMWFYIVYYIFFLLKYPKQKLSNQIT